MRRWSGRGRDLLRRRGSMNSVKPLQWVGIVLGLTLALYFVYSYLEYFGNVSFLGGILLLEVLIASLWKYEQRYFVWTRTPRRPFGSLHLIAFFCVCAAFVSATVSPFIQLASSKALSLLLLFVYCASCARLAVFGREQRFFRGLLWGSEIAVYVTTICYLGLGQNIWGNPNALGGAMSIAVFPVLLWGWLTSERPALRLRRLVALLLCIYLVLFSGARAGMASTVLVTLIFCVCLHQYKLLVKVAALVLVLIAVTGMLAP